MKYFIDFGYYGEEIGRMSGSTSHKNSEEPTPSIEKIVKFFNLEKEEAKIILDLDLVWQGSNKDAQEQIKNIWKDIIFKKWRWHELKLKLLKLLKLGENRLPVVFKIKYGLLEIDIAECEYNISIISENLDKLNELKNLLIKERKERISPYGRIGSSKELNVKKVSENRSV